jgi:uncharacterized protein with ParB-like and HNH nuclease domain
MAELHVSKKTMGKLLSDMQEKKFIIPDFQRPYKWDKEKCERLWIDVTDFFENDPPDADYFLGTIVTAENENKNPEVIDGQQRITSFFLLLRAFYKKLEGMKDNEDVLGLKMQVGPCIWDVHPISKRVNDFSKIHIDSQVATDDDNEIFHGILQTGSCHYEPKSIYSVNYSYFQNVCDQYAMDNPTRWYDLCVTILNRCIILPIECNNQETALTIFSTLNDRGLPLEDSDIFKAQIYKYLKTSEKRKEFTETWRALSDICKDGLISIDDTFRYYTHVLRARNNDKSKEVALRKFYGENKYERLKQPELMDNILTLANFWTCVNRGFDPDEDEGYSISFEAKKYLHCLSWYPNEYWKYTTSVFFLKNKNSKTFNYDFCQMLKKQVAFLFVRFIESPTVNAIKDNIYSTCISIQSKNEFKFEFDFLPELVGNLIERHENSKISRALLLLDSYLNINQTNLIPESFEIEHIFPRKWQNTNYNGWNIDDAQFYLNRFGNKIVLEKKLNIQAGNGYFGIKKQKYATSKISSVIELSTYPKNDWTQGDIELREKVFKNRLMDFFMEHLN